jgi:hypothetical protein
VPKPGVIEDYHGTEITVDGPVYKSAGVFVYVEFSGRELTAAEVRAECIDGEFVRLAPDQARNLAKQLQKAAEEAER